MENTFAVMASRFRIFRRTINLLPENADYVVKTTCLLPNFLREDSIYMSQSCADSEDAYGNVKEGQWREILKNEGSAMFVLKPPVGHNFGKSVGDARDLFRSYFVSTEGSVSWQLASAGLKPVTNSDEQPQAATSGHGWPQATAFSYRAATGHHKLQQEAGRSARQGSRRQPYVL